jgi:glycine/D-amino acid oxidase-like deaminating enzyme
MQAVFALQNEHGIDTATLTPAEAQDIHPLLQFEDAGVIGYDSMAGYADPYLTTSAYARRARDLGVSIRTDVEVRQITVEGSGFRIETSAGSFSAGQVLIAAGPWTGQLASTLGASLPYEISQHKVITLKIEQDYDLNWPIVKDLTTPDKIYFRPEVGGVVLVGTGDHGEPIERPEMGFGNSVDRSHIDRIAPLVANRMPRFSDARYIAGWTGPYDITPDWNPILDELPESPGVFVAVGFSGHGFKLAPTLGEGLARRILDLPSRIPIEPYGLSRFALGQALSGAYGIGSIS